VTIFYCTQTFANVVGIATLFAKCILALFRLRNYCRKSEENIFIALKPRAQNSEGIPRSLLLSGKNSFAGLPLIALASLKNCQTSTSVAFKGGRWCCCALLGLNCRLVSGKNPVCANALTIRGGPRLSSRPLWDAAHCLCVLLPSRDTHSCRARCALYFQVSHALPASLRTPTPAIKKTKRRFTLCKNYHLETPVHGEKDAS
jgi:hypothetical protein